LRSTPAILRSGFARMLIGRESTDERCNRQLANIPSKYFPYTESGTHHCLRFDIVPGDPS
jgi:hypothetical protein